MPRSRTIRSLLSIAAAAAVAAGCGQSASVGDGTETTPRADPRVNTVADHLAAVPGSDTALTEAALLQPSDLPADWTPVDDEDRSYLLTCPAHAALAALPRAEMSFGFKALTVHHEVVVLATPAAAQQALARLLSKSEISCVKRATTEEAERTTEDERSRQRQLTLGHITARRIEAPPLGLDAGAVRVRIPLQVYEQELNGGLQLATYDDVVHIRVGRVLATLTLAAIDVPDRTLRTLLAGGASVRLKAAVAAAR